MSIEITCIIFVVALVVGTIGTGFKSAAVLMGIFVVVALVSGQAIIEAAYAMIFVSVVCFLIRAFGWIAVVGGAVIVISFIAHRMM